MKKLIVILLIFSFVGCLKEEPLRLPFQSFEPKVIDDGMIISNPANENVDSEALNQIYADIYADENLWPLKSILVFRNGNLIAESYLKDSEDISNQDLIWSCTKQFIGILVGMAVEQGFIESIDDPISKYMPKEFAEHADKQNIAIKNFITMQSGIEYYNDGTTGQTDKLLRRIPENSIEFILERPVFHEQGTFFHYNDGDPHLMSALLSKVTGKPTDEWADEVLFSKIGIKNYSWTRYTDGVPFGGFGILTSPRELGKMALFVAKKGELNGEQILSKEWINEMTKEQVEVNDEFSFGYYWWINPERNIHFMWGHGGQFAYIIPDKNMVVIMTSIPNTQGFHQIDAAEALEYVDRIMESAY